MSIALDRRIKAIYLAGPSAEIDLSTTRELRAASADLLLGTVSSSSEAAIELRRSPEWSAIVLSPSLPPDQVLTVVASLRRERPNLLIIPTIDDVRSELRASALAAGADDVLVRREQSLVNVQELLARIRQEPGRGSNVTPFERPAIQASGSDREDRLRRIVEYVPTGIAVIAADGVVMAMNRAALELFGAVTPRDIVGREVLDWVAGEHREQVRSFIEKVTAGERTSAQFDVILVTGSRSRVRAQGVLLHPDARGGRGVIASIAAAPTVVPPDPAAPTFELIYAQQALEEVEQDRAAAAEAQQAERAQWESERGSLTARRDQLAADLTTATDELGQRTAAFVAERRTLEDRLGELSRQQAVADAARAAEREVWAAEREQLKGRAAAVDRLTVERDQLTARLGLATSEAERRVEAHATERRALDSRIQELAELRTADDRSRSAERAGWDKERVELAERAAVGEAATLERDRLASELAALAADRARRAEVAAGEHHWLDARVEELERALTSSDAAHATERAAWGAERTRLEALSETTSDLAAERDRHADELAALSGELEHRIDVFAAERTVLEGRVHELERQRAAIDETLSGERSAWDTERSQLLVDRDVQTSALTADRDRLSTERDRMSTELTAVTVELEQRTDAFAAERRTLETRVEALEEQQAAVESALVTARASLAEERDRLASELAALTAELERRSHAFGADRQSLDARLNDVEARRAAAEDAFATARASWDAERDQLASTLAAVNGELERRSHAFGADRQSLEARLNDLEARRTAAEGTFATARASWDAERDQLASTLAAVNGELERRTDAFGSDRQSLEARLNELEARRAAAEDTFATARASWDAERDQLASTIADVNGELERRTDTFGRERQALEARVGALEDQQAVREAAFSAERDRLRGELTTVTSDLTRQIDTLSAERQTLEAWVEELEQAQRTAADALAAERSAGEAARVRHSNELAVVAGDLEDRTAAFVAERDALVGRLEDTSRRLDQVEIDGATAIVALQQELETLNDRMATDAHAWATARIGLEHEIDAARQTLTSEQHSHDVVRSDLEREVSRLYNQLADEGQRAEEDRQARTRDLGRAQAEAAESTRQIEELRARSTRELDDLRRMFDDERAAWQAARVQLEEQIRLAAERAALDALDCQSAHASIEAELQAAREMLSAERSNWQSVRADFDAMRARLEQELHAAREAAARADEERHGLRRQLEADLQTARDMLAIERRDREAARERLEHALRAAYDAIADGKMRAEAAHAELERRYAAEREAWAAEKNTYETERGLADGIRRQHRRLSEAIEMLHSEYAAIIGGQEPSEPERRNVTQSIPELETTSSGLPGVASFHQPAPDAHPSAEPERSGPAEERARAARLEALGALTASMAPEIESLATLLEERSRTLLARAGDAFVSAQDLEPIAKATSRLTALVRQITLVTRRQLRDAERANLDDVVGRVEPILSRLAGPYVTVTIRRGHPPAIVANPDDLEQLVLSLVTYVRDGLPHGGAIALETRAGAADGEASGGAMLSVRGQGYGLDLPSGISPALERLAARCSGRLRQHLAEHECEVVFTRPGTSR